MTEDEAVTGPPWFLIETEYRWSPDDTERRVQIMATNELVSYLYGNIENEHYSGDGDKIIALYRYEGTRKMTKLAVHCIDEIRVEDDYLDWPFIITEGERTKGTLKQVLSFTVRIDGAA